MPFDYTSLGSSNFDYTSLAQDPTPSTSGPSQVLALKNPNNYDPSIWGVTPTTPNGAGTGANSINHPSQVAPHFAPPQTPDFSAISSAIQRVQSPYMTMGANGWLQNNHPGIASGLDNALAALSNLRQGHTIGENIAAVAGSLAGARQQRYQHDVQEATLPLQLAQQQIGYQQGLQNLYKTNAEIQHYGDMGEYYRAHADYWNDQADTNRQYKLGRLNQLDNRFGSKVTVDDNGRPWTTDLNSGQLTYAGADQLPQGYQPSFNKAGQRGPVGGGLWGNIAGAANGDPAAQQRLSIYGNVQSNIAGAKAGATDTAHQPKDTADKFLTDQKQQIASSLGTRPTPQDQKQFITDQVRQGLSSGQNVDITKLPSLEQRQQDYDTRKADVQKRFSRYTQSNDWRKGKGFDPNQYGDQPQAAPAANSTGPSTTNPYR